MSGVPARAPRSRGRPQPVPRHDGFTLERQRRFIDALAATASVRDAARAAGVSPTTAYRRRADPDADAFRLAWTAALSYAWDRLTDTAFDRAVNGVEEPVFYHGEQVGTRTRHNDRLLMFLLRRRDQFIPTVAYDDDDGCHHVEELYDARSFARVRDLVGPATAEAPADGPAAETPAPAPAPAPAPGMAPHASTSSLSSPAGIEERPLAPPVENGGGERNLI